MPSNGLRKRTQHSSGEYKIYCMWLIKPVSIRNDINFHTEGMKNCISRAFQVYIACAGRTDWWRDCWITTSRGRGHSSALYGAIPSTLLSRDTFFCILETFESLLSVTLPTIQRLHSFQISVRMAIAMISLCNSLSDRTCESFKRSLGVKLQAPATQNWPANPMAGWCWSPIFLVRVDTNSPKLSRYYRFKCIGTYSKWCARYWSYQPDVVSQ